MTQENKELLLKDLCARLPYGIKAEIKYYDDVWKLLAIYTNGTTYATRDVGYPIETCFEECKPYLLPLSSMTEEQKKEQEAHFTCINHDMSFSICRYMEWCYKNHLDVNGLIPKGLAIDATGLNVY
jgi:hypothetical protein